MEGEEWIIKPPDECNNEVGIKVIDEGGFIRIIEFCDESEFDSVPVDKGIDLDHLIRYLKEVNME